MTTSTSVTGAGKAMAEALVHDLDADELTDLRRKLTDAQARVRDLEAALGMTTSILNEARQIVQAAWQANNTGGQTRTFYPVGLLDRLLAVFQADLPAHAGRKWQRAMAVVELLRLVAAYYQYNHAEPVPFRFDDLLRALRDFDADQ